MEHYSFEMNDFIIELYPSNKSLEGNLIFGLEIKISVEEIMQRLNLISYDNEIFQTKDGSFSVKDPDGNRIIFDGIE